MAKNLLPLLLSILFLNACAKVTFSPTGGSNQKTEAIDPGDSGVCGDPRQPPHSVWQPVGPVTVTCPNSCPDGSKLKCTQFQEKEFNCLEGQPVATGGTRLSGPIESSGSCPVLPADCGKHADGTSWWSTAGSVSRICEICADGSPHNCLKEAQLENVCHNGVESPTGQQRDGDFISYQNECLPLPPKDCGDHANASSWWVEQGTRQAACQTCADGTKLKCDYAAEIQQTCNDGVVSATGDSRQGRYLDTIGKCPPPPRLNCGATPDGGLTWIVDGQRPPYDCDVCLDGSHRRCVRAQESQLKCDNGQLLGTGETRDGAFIGYVTSCPTNIVEKKKTVNIGQTVGKADVLVVLDTTPSMFLSLNNLGTRFQQLTSGWSRLDWQLAVTNAKMEKTSLEPHAMRGEFMELQKNDMTKPVEYIIKQGEPFAEPWFYRTVSRDPSDDGCNTQPYCMMSPAELLKSVMAAMDKKDKGANKGFFRSGAELVVIVVSSGDERLLGAEDPLATSPEAVLRHYSAKLGASMSGMMAMSVVIKPGDQGCLERFNNLFDLGTDGHYGVLADRFAMLTGGVSASLCDKDYGPALSKLSEKVRQEVQSVVLEDVPMAGTLQITFTPQVNLSWVLQGKKVLFDKPIPAGTKVDIRYLVKTN